MEMSVFKLKYVISNASHVGSQKITAQNAMVLIDNLYPLVYAWLGFMIMALTQIANNVDHSAKAVHKAKAVLNVFQKICYLLCANKNK